MRCPSDDFSQLVRISLGENGKTIYFQFSLSLFFFFLSHSFQTGKKEELVWLILKFQRHHVAYSSLPGNYSTSFFKDQTAGVPSHSVPLKMIMSFIGLFFVKKARYLINIHRLVKGLQKTQACNEKHAVIWEGGHAWARAHV